jgi:glutathione S-transferase
LHWAALVGLLLDFPSAQAYVERLRARPAFQAARRD